MGHDYRRGGCRRLVVAARSAGRAGIVRLATGIAMLALVSLTGHYGGNLTHGTTFLGEYAPPFLRSLIGAAPRRPPPTSVAAADPYLDVVLPLLEQRCGTCHNDDKREGGFSVGSYDSTLAGGDTGRAIVPGNLEASELIYRTGLPPDDEAFMPAEGKTPLTAEQVEILRWWVGAGAPRATTIEAIGAPRELEPLLAAQLGLGGPAAAAALAVASATADPQLVADLFAAGLLVRQVSQSDSRLVVSVNSPGTALSTAALAALNAAAAEIVDLNLADTAFDDAGLAAIGDLGAATHLRFARNRLTDGGVASLAALPQLAHLNLYGQAASPMPGSQCWRPAARCASSTCGRPPPRPKASRGCVPNVPSSSWTSAQSRRPPHVQPCRRRAQRCSGDISETDCRRENRQRPFSRTNSSS